MLAWKCNIITIFTARRSYASAVLGVVIVFVCLSVCHTRALWQNQTMHCGYLDTTRTGNHSSYTNSGWWATPIPSEICAQSDPPPSKNADFDRFPLITFNRKRWRKKFPMANRKSTTGFPTSYRWSAYVILKSSKGWLKKRFFLFFK